MPPRNIPATYFSKDVYELLEDLTGHGVEFMIIGGEAVIYYGYPRVTRDIDLFYRLTPKNVRRLYQAVQDFWHGDVPGLDSYRELAKADIVTTFGRQPRRVDLLNTIAGVDFEEAWKDSIEVDVVAKDKRIPVRVIGIEALIRNKKAAGRNKDLDDVRFLDAAQKRVADRSGRRRRLPPRKTS